MTRWDTQLVVRRRWGLNGGADNEPFQVPFSVQPALHSSHSTKSGRYKIKLSKASCLSYLGTE